MKKSPSYLVYDIMSFKNNSVGAQPYRTRLRIVDVEIIQPRSKAKSEMSSSYDFRKEPFSVKLKHFSLIRSEAEVKYFLDVLMPSLPMRMTDLFFLLRIRNTYPEPFLNC